MRIKQIKPVFLWLIGSLLLVTLVTGCGTPPPSLPPLGKDAVILAFGDSLTAGKGGQVSYPEFLSQMSGRQVINAGISGETSAGAQRRFKKTVQQHRPQLIILCTGGNDFLQRLDEDATTENIDKMVATAAALDIPLVLVAVPKLSIFADAHPLYEDIASQHGLWLENDILADVLHDSSLKSDRVHPNTEGYQKIAEAIFNLLQKANAL